MCYIWNAVDRIMNYRGQLQAGVLFKDPRDTVGQNPGVPKNVGSFSFFPFIFAFLKIIYPLNFPASADLYCPWPLYYI